MGKSAAEIEEQNLAAGGVGSGAVDHNVEAGGGFLCGCCNWIYRVVGFKCFLMLLLSIAVFLSALFWLPPFLQFADQKDLDLYSKFKDHDIVASFNLEKPVSFLDDNILQLEDDIYYEIGFPTTKVVILSLEPLAASNTTKVLFGVDPDAKDSKISVPSRSLIRASFASLVTNQSSLRLTTSLFGEPLSFEVLKFPGGITVIPQQIAFLLQKVQISFNFTLNFSIYQIQVNFNELTSQLMSGLHLTPYENLYIRLSNTKGSTVAPPTVVQSFVLLAVGISPSTPRFKQLAQTISGSHSKNLGLNNTVFGRVKQVRLSSISQHSVHGNDGSVPQGSPSPAPLPQGPQPHHHHHHHHHQHHHHHDNDHRAPAISPAPATQIGAPTTQTSAPAPQHSSPGSKKNSPAPKGSYEAKPPGCQTGNGRGNTGNARKPSPLAPAIAPNISPHISAGSPQAHMAPSTPMPAPVSSSRPASSPLPNVVFAHAHPPTNSGSEEDHSYTMPSVSPYPSPSSAGRTTVQLAFSLLLAIILLLK